MMISDVIDSVCCASGGCGCSIMLSGVGCVLAVVSIVIVIEIFPAFPAKGGRSYGRPLVPHLEHTKKVCWADAEHFAVDCEDEE